MEQRLLVERASRGDHDAFEALAAEAIGRLHGAARLILRDPELARDATQNALVRAWRDLPSLRDAERFDAWLHRLTVNACLDLSRRARRRPIEVEIATFDALGQADPVGALADRDELDRALAQLAPESRAIVVLHYYLGLRVPEIAAILRIPAGTVKSRLNRALAVMRHAITAGGDTPGEPLAEGQPA